MRRSIRNFNIPPPGIPRAFDCASCPGRGEFECCIGRVGNLNWVYLLFWRNTPLSFFRFLQGLTDLQERISPLLENDPFKRVFNSFPSRLVFSRPIEPLVTSSFLKSPNCFDKQLIQQGQIHQYVCPFWISTKLWQGYTRKNVSTFGCKIGGKIGQVT